MQRREKADTGRGGGGERVNGKRGCEGPGGGTGGKVSPQRERNRQTGTLTDGWNEKEGRSDRDAHLHSTHEKHFLMDSCCST